MNQLVTYRYYVYLHNGHEIELDINETRYQKLLATLVADKSKFIKINNGAIATSAISYAIRKIK